MFAGWTLQFPALAPTLPNACCSGALSTQWRREGGRRGRRHGATPESLDVKLDGLPSRWGILHLFQPFFGKDVTWSDPHPQGDLEESRAHVLTDYPDKGCLTCALILCSDTMSGITSGMCSDTDFCSAIKPATCSGQCSDWHTF